MEWELDIKFYPKIRNSWQLIVTRKWEELVFFEGVLLVD